MSFLSHCTRSLRLLALASSASLLFGCAAVKLPAPVANAATVEKIKSANVVPMAAGTFALAVDKKPEMDQTLAGLRGSSLAPESGSFSQYLKDELIADLKAAGLYDQAANTVVGAQLTDSMVDASIGTGAARLAAKFTVDRSGKRVFDKELAVTESWESSFVGAVALPLAINQYTSLYKKLIVKLFDDAQFRTAVAPAR